MDKPNISNKLAECWKNEFSSFKKVEAEAAENTFYFYGEIVPDAVAEFYGESAINPSKVVDFLASVPEGDAFTVRFNSPGGELHAGWTIKNLFGERSGDMTAVTDGLCASAATFSYCEAETRVMNEGSRFMIHRVHGGPFGTADHIRNFADTMDSMDADLVDKYDSLMNLSKEEINEAMDKETFYSAKEAKEIGIANQDPPKAKAKSKDKKRASNAVVAAPFFAITQFQHLNSKEE